MDQIHKFRVFNKLKSVYRFTSVDGRKESVAEHSWSCLVLADFFLSQMKIRLDRVKIYELLMYHDVVEIETGDVPLHPEVESKGKKEKEMEAMLVLKEKIPDVLSQKFVDLFQEFEDNKTKEAKFARAIDQLDAEIQELDHKEDWKGWTREFVLEKKGKFFNEFPELKKAFDSVLDYLTENNYFH